MGSVYSYPTSNGKRYRVIYRRPDHSQGQKRGFTTKREAELYLAHVETTKARGDYVNPTDANVPVGRLGAEWLRGRRGILKPSTFHSVESSWPIHVEPKWGRRAIGELRHSEVQSWISELSSRYSATTVLRCHGILAAILDSAIRDQRLTQNAARNVSLPKKQRISRAYLTHQQVAALADTSRFPTVVYALAYTGIRWGELAGLRVGNIDFTRRRLLVAR
jgi:integrase